MQDFMPSYIYFAKRVTKATGKVKDYGVWFNSKKAVRAFLNKKKATARTNRFSFEYARDSRYNYDIFKW